MRRAIVSMSILALAACASEPPASPGDDGPAGRPSLEIRTSSGVVSIRVEVADQQGERAVGLMHRESLAEDAGMVFLWAEPLHTTFWMKDTLIPLSIAFWDERGRILSILDMEPCPEGRCPDYDPGVEFIGAVEVNQGFFDDAGVAVGDVVELEGATGVSGS